MKTTLKCIALGAGVSLFAIAPALALTDAQFLNKALQGDNSEVALGRLALSKADQADVKTFAQMLIDDHSKSKTQVLNVAKQEGVTPTDDVSPDAKAEMNKLEPLSGAAFDKAFVSYMVSDHEKDIADFKAQASTSKGDVKQLATESLPTLQKHLDMAKSLAGKV